MNNALATMVPHIEDAMLGGSSDILEFGGSRANGRIVIELKRKMDTGDRFDRPLHPDSPYP